MIRTKRTDLLVVDIETVPDERYKEIEKFPPPAFHRIIAIGFLQAQIQITKGRESYLIKQFRAGGDESYGERQLIDGFFRLVSTTKPRLVTYNGRSFDLAVIKYRAIAHQLEAPASFSDLYKSRFDIDRHCDLLDVLTDYGASVRMRMSDLGMILGLPGKWSIDGSKVATLYKNGRLAEIRRYCEIDVLNTYILYLRYALFAGFLGRKNFEDATKDVMQFLELHQSERPHFRDALQKWKASRVPT